MLAKTRTFSEQLFEDYLRSQGLTNFAYEKEWEGIPTRPDYTVYHKSDVYVFDVKQFENQTSIPLSGSFGVEPYSRIREKINRVRSQFKYFKDKPCCLVLYTLDPFIRLREASVVLSAMYGDLGFTTLYDKTTGRPVPKSTKREFLENGKMLRYESGQAQNQTISTLITLRIVGQTGEVGVIVWENYFARRQFPRSLFCGPFDERWGRNGDSIEQVFVGNRLADYQR